MHAHLGFDMDSYHQTAERPFVVSLAIVNIRHGKVRVRHIGCEPYRLIAARKRFRQPD